MAKAKSVSIFGTLQKTTETAGQVNSEFVRQLPVDQLTMNPLNRFSMKEDEAFEATLHSVEQDGFLEDIIVAANDDGTYRIISGHRRVAMARKLGKRNVPCKVRAYESELEEIRALMGANIHKRAITPLDMARQLQTLSEVLDRTKGKQGAKERANELAEQTGLSRATVERYLDLLNLDETITAWVENGQVNMTDAYELARKKNIPLYPLVEKLVSEAADQSDFPALVHRALLSAQSADAPLPPPRKTVKPADRPDPVKTIATCQKASRRALMQLQSADLSSLEPEDARKRLSSYLKSLDELRAAAEQLLNGLGS